MQVEIVNGIWFIGWPVVSSYHDADQIRDSGRWVCRREGNPASLASPFHSTSACWTHPPVHAVSQPGCPVHLKCLHHPTTVQHRHTQAQTGKDKHKMWLAKQRKGTAVAQQ